MIRQRGRAVGLALASVGTAALAAWTAVVGAPVLVPAMLLVGAAVLGLTGAQGVRPTRDGLRLRYVLRRRTVAWHDILDVRFAEFRQFGERLERPAVITASRGPIRLPGVEAAMPLIRQPTWTALHRVEEAWRSAVTVER